MKFRTILLVALFALTGCNTPVIDESLTLESDNQALVDGFSWAKDQALSYAYEGDSVGKWFEASLPGRDAFCMRDVSHQAYGALALGLDDHLKNMMHKFTLNISEGKDWCTFWEINKYNKPAPVDYTSDEEFWYNLPANFDVIDACYRIYQWTGDLSYLQNPDFINFYEKSLNEYIHTWDLDNDGLLESPKKNHPRGIATYWEAGGPHAETGTDLLAAQITALKSYGKILSAKNMHSQAVPYFHRADKLFKELNYNWWYAEKSRFYTSHLKGEVFDTTLIPAMQIFALYWDVVDQDRKPSLFFNLQEGVNVEENTYLAEVYYKNGFRDKGFQHLMRQLDPDLKRKEYPENPYTAIGTIVTQLIGLKSFATEEAILTRSGLNDETKWIKISNLPIQNRMINIMQVGQSETEIEMIKGEPILWHSRFDGEFDQLEVNGKLRKTKIKSDDRGNSETHLALTIKEGQTIRVTKPDY